MTYEELFIAALLFTILIETAMLLLMLRVLKIKRDLKELLFAGILASSATLPYLWFVLPSFISPYSFYVAAGEILVILFEALIYAQILKLEMRIALIVSFACNLISFLMGIMLFWK